MTQDQHEILLYAIKKVTGLNIFDDPCDELRNWVTNQGLEVVERTIRPSFGNPAYLCKIINNQVLLHESSGYTSSSALVYCVGELCKNILIQQQMKS